MVCLLFRYYDKSKIEEEILEMRSSGGQEHWKETKRSIKEARYRLSIQRNSLNIGSDTIQLRSKSKSLPADVISEVTSDKLGTTLQGIGQKIYVDMNGHEASQLSYLRSVNGHRNLVYIEDSHLEPVING